MVICKNTTVIELFQVTFAIPPLKLHAIKHFAEKSGDKVITEEDQVYYKPHLLQPSPIIDEELLSKLYGLLPSRYRISDPTRLYSSEKQGFGLRTLYSSVENAHPTFVIIQTDKDAIIGAFTTSSWSVISINNKGILPWSGEQATFIFFFITYY